MASAVTEFIKTHAAFTSAELLERCGNDQNTRNMLHNAVSSGRVHKVKRGLYVSNAGRFEGTMPPAQIIAAKAASDAVLCHSSAFSLFLGNHDILNEVPLYTRSKMKPFSFDGVLCVPYPFPRVPLETKEYRLADGTRVRGTTKEQTIADSLTNVSRAGGVESLLRRLSAVHFLDINKTVEMVCSRGPSACARLGWVFERKALEWGVSEDALDALSHKLGRGPYYLGAPGSSVSFDSRWRLYLTEDPQTMEGWING